MFYCLLYLATLTLVSTDTVTQALISTASLLALGHLLVSEVLATQDALTLLQVRSEGADVGLVHIIDDNGGHSNDLSRASGHDSHQDEEEHGVLSSGAQELLGHQRSGKTLGNIFISQHRGSLGRGQAQVGKTHGGGQSEGDGKPDQASTDESPDTLQLSSF